MSSKEANRIEDARVYRFHFQTENFGHYHLDLPLGLARVMVPCEVHNGARLLWRESL